MLGLKDSAAQDLLGSLLLGFVVVGIPDQPVAHTVEHVDDVAEGLVHLAHAVVGGGLSHPTPAGTGNVLRRRPHLAGLVLHRLGVHIKTARHRPHLMRIRHKTGGHLNLSLSEMVVVLANPIDRVEMNCWSSLFVNRSRPSAAPGGAGEKTGCPSRRRRLLRARAHPPVGPLACPRRLPEGWIAGCRPTPKR